MFLDILENKMSAILLFIAIMIAIVNGDNLPPNCVIDVRGDRQEKWIDCSGRSLSSTIVIDSDAVGVDLTGNGIERFADIRLRMPRLKYLILTGNALGADSSSAAATISGTGSVEVLNLSKNNLSTIPHNLLNPMTQLRSLSLSDNQLNENSFAATSALRALVELDLDRNNLRAVPVHLRTKFAQLQVLKMSNNPIVAIDSESFAGLEQLQRLKLNSLQQLSRTRSRN